MAPEGVLEFILEKLKQALLAMEDLGRHLLSWFDGIFPPETRTDKISHWAHVALPYLIAAIALLALFCCCRRCCCRGRRSGRMMKAPGRNCRMPRAAFEADTKGYFQRLRSHPGDDLC